VPHLHTHGHRAIRRRARRARGRPLCAAGTMQSPMQFRAIQVRLAPSANDTVTVYPSPTHTRTIARENHRPRMQRVHATTVVPAAGCSRPALRALLREVGGCETTFVSSSSDPHGENCDSRVPRATAIGKIESHESGDEAAQRRT